MLPIHAFIFGRPTKNNYHLPQIVGVFFSILHMLSGVLSASAKQTVELSNPVARI